MAETNSIEIPWGVVLSILLCAITLIYFLFFQQYLTASIWKMFMCMFIPNNIQISFKRAIFSAFSGHFTMFDVVVITQDMSIRIGKVCCHLYYWRKIPDFSNEEENLKSRFILQIFGLDITIYNRTWSTDLVQNVVNMYNDGKTTKEIGKYILSFYPDPAPYQLSMLLRIILPLKLRVYSAAFTIGNPRFPSFLVFRVESISGYYTLRPKKSPEYSMQSFLDLDLNTFSLKSIPLTITETNWFKNSMRNVYDRSHCPYQIMHAENIELSILTDLYGLYVLNNDENLPNQVTKEPQMIIDATFNGYSAFQYGPYTDKLRRFFMEFFTPFVFNDPIIYPEPRKRIKYWVINLYFPEGSFLEIPFVTDQPVPKNSQNNMNNNGSNVNINNNNNFNDNNNNNNNNKNEDGMNTSALNANAATSPNVAGISPGTNTAGIKKDKKDKTDSKDNSNEKRNGTLTVFFGENSKCQMFIPQYIASHSENKMEVNAVLTDIKITTSIPSSSDNNNNNGGNNNNNNNNGNNLNNKNIGGGGRLKESEPIIDCPVLNLNVGMYYPEEWNGITQMTVFANFQGAKVILTPYHIDFLTQLGTDWASWYPFSTNLDTIFNFFPYSYFVTLVFEKSIINMFTESSPKYEVFDNPDSYPHAEIKTMRLMFKLAAPFIHFSEEQKSVTFSTELEKTKVDFYLPENHMMRIRRGPDLEFDYLTMDRFQLSGSYRWSSIPHDDCQIPMNMRISNVGGLITISTLVTLIGTIANYTSRQRKHPKIWCDPDPEPAFEYINQTNVIVSIDNGTVKIPLDLYEPNTGAIAHVSGLLIGIEGYHPFWHVIVDIGNAVVELPRTNFPYDNFFDQLFADLDGPKQGTFHVDGISITMKTITCFTGHNWVELHTKIGCEVGRIDGYALMPQLMCGLEIAWNIIHSFFSDDSFPIQKMDPFHIYKVEVFRITVGSIHVFLDLGSIGLVAAMLPGGVVVYSDTLIDENANYAIFVHLPSIDAHILRADPNTGEVHAIFRTSTYLNVVRDITFDNNKDDAKRQHQLFKIFDVVPNPEKSPRRNYYSYMFDFINQDRAQLDEDILFIPEMMRPETYHSSLNEKYELGQILVSDPRNNNEFSLPIPELKYKSYKDFINMEDGIQWLHHYETVRFYNHLSPSSKRGSNYFKNSPKSSSSLKTSIGNLGSGLIDPVRLATEYYEDDCKRAKYSHGAIRLLIPNRVIAQLRPEALINFAALLNSMNLMPNEQLMAKIVRSTVSDEYDLKNYHSNTINAVLPQVCVMIFEPTFDIALTVDSVNVRYVRKVNPVSDKNLTLYIKSVSLACSHSNSEHVLFTTTVPEIKLVKVNEKGAVSIDPIKVNCIAANSPVLLNSIVKKMSKYLEGFPLPMVGDRVEELIRIIKNNPIYEKELSVIRKTMYNPGECNTRYDVNCEVSALYSTLRQMNLHNYTQIYKMVKIPPLDPNLKVGKRSKMNIYLPPITVSIRHKNSISSILKLLISPLVIETENELTSISLGVKSLSIKLADEIVDFVKEILLPNMKKKKNGKLDIDQERNNGINTDNDDEYLESDNYNDVFIYQQQNYHKNHRQQHHRNTNSFSNKNNPPIISEMSNRNSIKFSDYDDNNDNEFSDNQCESKSKILVHASINKVAVLFNQFGIRLDNISLSLSNSHNNNFSVVASFVNFGITINKWASIWFKGISVSHEGESGEGMIHIKPIQIYILMDLIFHTSNYLDKKFLEKLSNFDSEDSENESNNYNSTIDDNKNEKFDNYSNTNNVNNNNNNNSTSNNSEQMIIRNQTQLQTDNNCFIDFLKKMSTSLLIDELKLVVNLTNQINAEVAFPRTCGFMHSSIDTTTHILCYFHQPNFSIHNYFSFSLPNFMFILKLQKKLLDAILMVGEIIAVANSERLSTCAYLVNEILSRFDLKSENNNNEGNKVNNNDIIIKAIRKRTNALRNSNNSKMNDNNFDEIYTTNNAFLGGNGGSSPSKINSIINNRIVGQNSRQNLGNSRMKICLRFEMPKFEMKFEEISTNLMLTQVSAELNLKRKSELTWRFDVDDILGRIFDSTINTSICGKSSKTTKLRFKVTPLEIILTFDLFKKITVFSQFFDKITEGIEKQEHVNSLLHQLNDHIQQTVETHADQILETIVTNVIPFESLEFPSLITNNILFSITEIKIQVNLPTSGCFVTTIPEVSLVVQTRESDSHSKSAVGAQFVIRDLGVILDTDENKGKRTNQLSSLKISALSISATSFVNVIDFDSIVDGLKIELFPTFPSSIAKLITIGSTISEANSLIQHQKHNKEKKQKKEIRKLQLHEHQFKQKTSISSSKSTPNIHKLKGNFIKDPKSDFNKTSKNTNKVSKNNKKQSPQISGAFKCLHSEVVLSPISNNLPLPSIEIAFNLMNNKILISFNLRNKVIASLTPALLGWLNTFKSLLPLLSKSTSNPSSLGTSANNLSRNVSNSNLSTSSHDVKSSSKKKTKSSARLRRKSSLSQSTEEDQYESTNSYEEEIEEDENVDEDEIIEDDYEEDEYDFDIPLQLSAHVIFRSKEIEVCFGCQPRRNDISCLVGISSIQGVGSTESSGISIVMQNIYLRTQNVFAIQSADPKTSRLFEFNIPQIDLCIGMNNMIINLERIFTSFSSDKIEEISLFNDIWIQPLLKMISSTSKAGNKNKKSSDSNNKPANNNNSHNYNKNNIYNYNGNNNNKNDNMNDNENQNEDDLPVEMEKRQINITLMIQTVELYFNYAAGAGNLNLILRPIRVSKAPQLIFATINSISLNSAGQLLCKFDLKGLLFIISELNEALMNVTQFQSISLNMSMTDEPFLIFSLLKMNLLCRVVSQLQNFSDNNSNIKNDGNDSRTILQLSLDSPDMKLTALTVPNLRTFIKTISEPIIAGVARANRSDEKKKKLVKVAPKFIPLFANLDILSRRLKIILLRYDFRDNDAIMFTIKAAMLHLGIQPEGKGMKRNLKFQFLPISLQRLFNTTNELIIATNNDSNGDFSNDKNSRKSSNVADSNNNNSNNNNIKKNNKEIVRKSSLSSMSTSASSLANSTNNNSNNSSSSLTSNASAASKDLNGLNPGIKSRSILRLPRIEGNLDTNQKAINSPNINYDFITDFNGNIEPTLNLSDYEMLVALIKYTVTNLNLGNSVNTNDNQASSSISPSFSSKVYNSNNYTNNNSSIQKKLKKKKKSVYDDDESSSFGDSNDGGSDDDSGDNNSNINSFTANEDLEDEINQKNKIHYKFTPLNYRFAPGFKVGIGASINPDIAWLLARFGISDEHIIPASLFEVLCIGLESFLTSLTSSMTKKNNNNNNNNINNNNNNNGDNNNIGKRKLIQLK